MMTEEEAKTKWCPFASARVVRWDVNAIWGDPPTNACIASACMAWRWRVMTPAERSQAIGHQTRLGDTFDEAVSKVNRWDGKDGYCGLAGAPA